MKDRAQQVIDELERIQNSSAAVDVQLLAVILYAGISAKAGAANSPTGNLRRIYSDEEKEMVLEALRNIAGAFI